LKKLFERQRLLGNPVGPNESPKLELPGLGNLRTVKTLEKIANKKDPVIVFLMDTKSNREWMSEVKDKCNMKNGFIFPSKGNSGGLVLLWKEEIMVDVKTYSHDHIDAWVNGGLTVGWWHLTRFYGNPETVKCPESWAKLKHLKGTSSLPWLVIGDFNKIMGLSKKEGGSIRLRRQMEQVVDTINMCGLHDVGFIGSKFTWIYQQANGTQIWERLDRALATPE